MIKRTRAREQALQILYFMDMTGIEAGEAMDLFAAHFEEKDADSEYARNMVFDIEERKSELDSVIEKFLVEWKLSRLPRVDRNILRIGAYEVRFQRDLPGAVILDEAVELGKKYGDTKSGAFINGILDKIARQERGPALA